jgi:hypothetical protein
MNLQQLYNDFLESTDKELFEIMPNATGIWEKDKKEFIEIHKHLVLDISDEFEEEEDEY